MNYVLTDDGIIFRTVPDGEVARNAMDTTCAFEIDDVDEFFESGWSVLPVGVAQLLTEADFQRLRVPKIPEPWVDGPRILFVKLQLRCCSSADANCSRTDAEVFPPSIVRP